MKGEISDNRATMIQKLILQTNRNIFFSICLGLLLACCTNQIGVKASKIDPKKFSKGMQNILNQWKNDSLGCEHYRHKDIAEAVIDSLDLENAWQQDFIKVFGKPNYIIEREGRVVLGYYFDVVCINGRAEISKDVDYCMAEFTFVDKAFLQKNYICT